MSDVSELVRQHLAAETARRAEAERRERAGSHVRAGGRIGGRRLMDSRGSPGRTLCGGDFTSYDSTLREALGMERLGVLAKWVGCAACRENVRARR